MTTLTIPLPKPEQPANRIQVATAGWFRVTLAWQAKEYVTYIPDTCPNDRDSERISQTYTRHLESQHPG